MKETSFGGLICCWKIVGIFISKIKSDFFVKKVIRESLDLLPFADKWVVDSLTILVLHHTGLRYL